MTTLIVLVVTPNLVTPTAIATMVERPDPIIVNLTAVTVSLAAGTAIATAWVQARVLVGVVSDQVSRATLTAIKEKATGDI